MSALLSPLGLVGIGLLLVFTWIAFQRPGRGVVLYGVLGAVPAVQFAAFSGRTSEQGLLAAEGLATILILAWLVRRANAPGRTAMPFEGPLWIFTGIAALSLVLTVAMPDPRIDLDASVMVSIGQVLLILWPVGVYLASVDGIDGTASLQWLHLAVITLASFQLVVPLLPDAYDPYTAWATNFGLFAMPLALASLFYSPRLPIAALYLVLTVLPFVQGVAMGKAFLYVYAIAAAGTILVMRAPRMLAILGGGALVLLLGGFAIGGTEFLADPLSALVQKERSQSSWGGASGRVALAEAAISIWQEAPIVGVGPGNSYLYMLQRSPIGTPHSQYLNILVEFGLAGLAAWMAFLAVAFRTGVRVYRHVRRPEHQRFALGWLGVFAGMTAGGLTGDFMIHSIRNGGLELFSGYYLQWVLLGLMAALPRLERAAEAPARAARRPMLVTRPARIPRLTIPRRRPGMAPAGPATS